MAVSSLTPDPYPLTPSSSFIPKLADFGLVKFADAGTRLTATGVVLGTMDYISPEQTRGQAVDGRSDLYALGVVAFLMLSGRLPFEAKTPSAKLFQHVYETPPPLGSVAKVPAALAAVIDKLLAKDAAHRYQSCEEVLRDLRRWRAGGQGPGPVPERTGEPGRERPAAGLPAPVPPDADDRTMPLAAINQQERAADRFRPGGWSWPVSWRSLLWAARSRGMWSSSSRRRKTSRWPPGLPRRRT
jgi:serine/threonine protein kinase